ncbi:MAG: hypothetical protein WA188_07625 [Terriglobales bacterium]
MRSRYSTAAEHLGWLALLVVLTALTAEAQTPPAGSRNDVGAITVRGCLQAGADHTTLTDRTGTTYLLEHVSVSSRGSSFVEVQGEQFSPSGERGEAALPQVRVSSMRRLSHTCPQKILPPPSNPKPPLPSAQSPSTPPYQSPNAPQPEDAAPVLNTQGAGGAPSPGTGNTQDGKK